jgi:peptidoglycan biosynthesis protein MviN/MurJ (putative lipid II flippase)
MLVVAGALIPAFGSPGAAAATAVTLLVSNAVASAALYRLARTHPLDRAFVTVAATSLIPLAAALAIGHWLPPRGLLGATGWSLELWGAWLALLFAVRGITVGEVRRLTAPLGLRGGRLVAPGDAAHT